MHPIENIMKTTMEQLTEMIDVNTIVGDVVHTPDGSVIIPISRVSFGFVSGGGEYGEGGSVREAGADATDNPFAGGSGAGVTIDPMAFVVVTDDKIRLLPVHYTTTFDRVVELFPQALDFARDVINKTTPSTSTTSTTDPGGTTTSTTTTTTSM
jgi:sporulation protein YtfJ